MYIFADRYDVPQLRRAVVNDIWSNARSDIYPYHLDVILACGNIPSDSPLYNLLVDAHASRPTVYPISSCAKEIRLGLQLPSEFLFRLVVARSCNKDRTMRLKSLCAYHEHDQSSNSRLACKREGQDRRDQLNADTESRCYAETGYGPLWTTEDEEQ